MQTDHASKVTIVKINMSYKTRYVYLGNCLSNIGFASNGIFAKIQTFELF